MNRTACSRNKVQRHTKIRDINKNRGIKASFASKAACLILVILVLYFSGLFINQLLKVNHLEAALSELKEEIARAEKENDNLLEEVELLHNPEYIEILARKELGLIKTGEVLFNVDKDRYVFREKEQ